MTRRTPPARLHLERLDDRCVPAEFTTNPLPPSDLSLKDYQVRPELLTGTASFALPATVRDLAVGYRAANTATAHVWNVKFYTDAQTVREFTAYELPRNPGLPLADVRTAVADVTGDGVPDVVTALSDIFTQDRLHATPAEPVKVFDGAAILALPANAGPSGPLTPVRSWHPFGATFTGGLFVAAGDFDGDGKADVVATRDGTGTGEVRVYAGADVVNPASALKPKALFDGITDPNFHGGCHAAVGDLNADGVPDLLVGAGATGDPRVAGFDGASIRANWGTATAPGRVFNDFYAFAPGSGPARNFGIHVAAADLDGDGYGEVLAGYRGDEPRMAAIDGRDLVASGGGTQTVWWDRLFGDPATKVGLRIAARDLDGDARTDLVLSHALGVEARFVTTILGRNTYPNGWVLFPGRFDALPNNVPNSVQGVWVG